MEQYFGPLKVRDILEPDENNLAIVLFEDGSSQLVNKEYFDAVSSDKPLDMTGFVNEKMNFLVPKILKVLLDYNIELDDIQYMVNKMHNSINMSLENAEATLWGKPISRRTMRDVDEVLMSKKVTLKDVLGG